MNKKEITLRSLTSHTNNLEKHIKNYSQKFWSVFFAYFIIRYNKQEAIPIKIESKPYSTIPIIIKRKPMTRAIIEITVAINFILIFISLHSIQSVTII